MMSSHHAARTSRMLPFPRMNASSAIGTMMSPDQPISGPRKCGGSTPMIVNGCRDNVIVLPTMSGAPPKRRCQNASLMTATGPCGPPPRTSSAIVNVRPAIGVMPRTSNMFPLANAPLTMSLSPCVDRSNREPFHANAFSKICVWRSRICSQMGFVHDPPSISTRRAGSRTGSDFNSRLLRMENNAVFAPTPSASERTAMTVTTGVARSERQASRKSTRNADMAAPFGRSRFGVGAGPVEKRMTRPNHTTSSTAVIQNRARARSPERRAIA